MPKVSGTPITRDQFIEALNEDFSREDQVIIAYVKASCTLFGSNS
jgi:hypothetical protein